jgi:tetratricopeptide (TPR) repeat protein
MAKDSPYLRSPNDYDGPDQASSSTAGAVLFTAQELPDRANGLMDSRDLDHAIADYSQATARDARSDAALAGRGTAYLSKNDAGKAIADFNVAEAINPTNPIMFRGRGMLALLEDALSVCDEAVAKGPRVPAFLDSRGFVLLRLGRYNESIAAYDAALALRPKYGDSLYGGGLARLRAGDAYAGNRDVSAALEIDKQVADRFAGFGLKP